MNRSFLLQRCLGRTVPVDHGTLRLCIPPFFSQRCRNLFGLSSYSGWQHSAVQRLAYRLCRSCASQVRPTHEEAYSRRPIRCPYSVTRLQSGQPASASHFAGGNLENPHHHRRANQHIPHHTITLLRPKEALLHSIFRICGFLAGGSPAPSGESSYRIPTASQPRHHIRRGLLPSLCTLLDNEGHVSLISQYPRNARDS